MGQCSNFICQDILKAVLLKPVRLIWNHTKASSTTALENGAQKAFPVSFQGFRTLSGRNLKAKYQGYPQNMVKK